MIYLFYFSLSILLSLFFVICVWFISKKTNNASIIDVFWPMIVAVVALLLFLVEGLGNNIAMIATLMALFWGARLSFHINEKQDKHGGEDPRYTALSEGWGEDRDRKMFKFYLLQGIGASIFSLPFLIVNLDLHADRSIWEVIGFLVWLVAIAGETISDLQLKRFKQEATNRGRVCEVGLWEYSRHPNYFFEWLIWVAFALYALGSRFGVVALICPVMMFHFLHNVTGVPIAEEQSLKSRGEAYADYQKRVSKFFPWFPRS